MKLVYSKDVESYLILGDQSVARIFWDGEDYIAGIFHEDLNEIIKAFCNGSHSWLENTEIEDTTELIFEFETVQELRDNYAEILI